MLWPGRCGGVVVGIVGTSIVRVCCCLEFEMFDESWWWLAGLVRDDRSVFSCKVLLTIVLFF